MTLLVLLPTPTRAAFIAARPRVRFEDYELVPGPLNLAIYLASSLVTANQPCDEGQRLKANRERFVHQRRRGPPTGHSTDG